MADRPNTLANILANGDFTTSDVLNRMPVPDPLSNPRGYIGDYLRRQGREPSPDLANALAREPSSSGIGSAALANQEPNWLGQALQHAPPEAMFAANFIAPNVRLPRVQSPIKAYHGSPHDFDEFKTPAFFSRNEGIARQYRRDGGGQDNLNGLGGYNTPEGWYLAHGALDRAGQNKTKAIEALEQEIKEFSTPLPHHYQGRSLVDIALGRPAKLTPEFEEFVQRHTALNRAGIDYLKSGAPLGKVYEAELPRPTAHYDGDQAADIADAIAKGHKVITWGGKETSGEIVALDKNVIDIIRKYGIAAPIAGAPTLANILSGDGEQ